MNRLGFRKRKRGGFLRCNLQEKAEIAKISCMEGQAGCPTGSLHMLMTKLSQKDLIKPPHFDKEWKPEYIEVDETEEQKNDGSI